MSEYLQAVRDFLNACTAGSAADTDLLVEGDPNAPDQQVAETRRVSACA